MALTSITNLLGMKERGRSVAMGEWIAPAFNAANFAATGGGSWTVAAPGITTFAYTLVGKALTVQFIVGGTTILPVSTLTVAIPGGFVSAKTMTGTYIGWNPVTGTTIGYAIVMAGGNTIGLNNMTGNWGNNAVTSVYTSITFEIQ